jgi:hypothetical protein
MIKNYICEKKMLSQYISVQIYSKNDSNNCKTWWNVYSYI